MSISVYQLQIRKLNITQKKPLSITEWLNVWKPELLIEGTEETEKPDTDSPDLITELQLKRKNGLLHQSSIEEIHI